MSKRMSLETSGNVRRLLSAFNDKSYIFSKLDIINMYDVILFNSRRLYLDSNYTLEIDKILFEILPDDLIDFIDTDEGSMFATILESEIVFYIDVLVRHNIYIHDLFVKSVNDNFIIVTIKERRM
jgi:hypothetical protein